MLTVEKWQDCLFSVLSDSLQTHKLDPSNHYLRLKVWNDGQMLFYVPKLEEDISDVVRKHTLKHLVNKYLRGLNSTTVTSDDFLIVASRHLCLFWIFPYCFVTWITPGVAENDLGPSLFSHCRACDEFSLWWCFVGDTLNPLSAKSLQNCLFPREAFDQQPVFALFHPRPAIIRYYFSEHHSLLFPSAAVYTQLCLCSPPAWGQKTSPDFSGATWILTILVWLHWQGAWIIHEPVQSLINGDAWPWLNSEILHPFFFWQLHVISLCSPALQRDWDLHQRHKGDPIWQGRVLHHRLR